MSVNTQAVTVAFCAPSPRSSPAAPSIGKVDKHSDEVGDASLVVYTRVWIFGKEVMLLAGTVDSIDPHEKKVFVGLAKQQLKDSPEFD